MGIVDDDPFWPQIFYDSVRQLQIFCIGIGGIKKKKRVKYFLVMITVSMQQKEGTSYEKMGAWLCWWDAVFSCSVIYLSRFQCGASYKH